MENLTEEFPTLLRTVGKKKFNNFFLPLGKRNLYTGNLPVLFRKTIQGHSCLTVTDRQAS
jgi:hypothetical protein